MKLKIEAKGKTIRVEFTEAPTSTPVNIAVTKDQLAKLIPVLQIAIASAALSLEYEVS